MVLYFSSLKRSAS